jgi:two-component system response regulator YesN
MGMGSNGDFTELSLTAEPRKFARLKDAKRYFSEEILKIEEHIRRRRNDSVLSRIDRAREIIGNRFAEKSFCLQDICSELYLSTSRFSALFKEGTGETFVEYLTEVRIDEAKRLLKSSDLRSYEIADRVGYQDPRYFSSIFKKVTGLTTTEYRKELEN